MKDDDKARVTEVLLTLPCALEADDVIDFCSLAQYYAMKTPSSFKQDLYSVMFGEGDDDTFITHALCLPVSAQELVENSFQLPSMSPNATVEAVRFFLVDCRPAEQYNAGHLPTAFHLDCDLVRVDIQFDMMKSECIKCALDFVCKAQLRIIFVPHFN